VSKGGSFSNDPRIRKLDYFYLAVIYKTGEMGHITGRATGYMFRYKKDPKVFYIGRTKDFHKRFKDHLSSNLKDRFHKFANSIG
jgi:hypothetical protein